LILFPSLIISTGRVHGHKKIKRVLNFKSHYTWTPNFFLHLFYKHKFSKFYLGKSGTFLVWCIKDDYFWSHFFKHLFKFNFITSKVHWEASDEGGNWERGGDESGKLESHCMTFPFKKRINTELYIDRNKGLYIKKGDKETDQKNKSCWPLTKG